MGYQSGKGWFSQREFAAMVDVSQPYIAKLVKQGKLTLTASGKIKAKTAMKDFKASGQPGKEYVKEVNKKQRGKKKIVKKKAPKKRAVKKKTTIKKDGSGTISVSETSKIFNEAKAKKEKYAALIKEQEYKIRECELIPLDQIKQDAKETMTALNSLLSSLPTRLAPKLLQRDSLPEIQAIIESEINNLKKVFYESGFIE